ncbi:MAG: PmoA family protein [Verrucomicrobiota bacterium]
MKHHDFRAATVCLLGVALSLLAAEPGGDGVKVTQKNDRVTVEINGDLFTEFWFQGNQHPAKIKKKGSDEEVTQPTRKVYYWPITGPNGAIMTRAWPIVPDSKNEEHDHPHHRGFWFAHGLVNGVDFWAEDAKAGRIVHDRFIEVKSGKDEGIIKSACKWVAPDNKVVCTDERVLRVYNRPKNERLFDFEITLQAPNDRDTVLGDTKEGTLAMRIAESMRLSLGKNKPGKGRIVQNTGTEGDKTWGKPAEWCDYSGPVEGNTVGIAIFDHPKNPVHPTWWHVRDYGLFAANPFGVHDFEKKPPGTGNLTIPAGKSITFKYRLYLHEGDERQGKVAERYEAYVKAVK